MDLLRGSFRLLSYRELHAPVVNHLHSASGYFANFHPDASSKVPPRNTSGERLVSRGIHPDTHTLLLIHHFSVRLLFDGNGKSLRCRGGRCGGGVGLEFYIKFPLRNGKRKATSLCCLCSLSREDGHLHLLFISLSAKK